MRVALASVLVVIASLPAGTAAQAPAFFPEMAALDALAPSEPSLYAQETWSASSLQHCWEWGFAEGARPSIEGSLRARVRARGWSDAELARGTLRRDGVAIAIAPGFRLDSLDPTSAVLKVAICTEGLAAERDRAAFMAALASDPMWPALPFGTPAVGWRRTYARGARAIGVALQLDDEAAARRWLEAAGYTIAAREPVLELRSGRARARFMGMLWWQREDRAP